MASSCNFAKRYGPGSRSTTPTIPRPAMEDPFGEDLLERSPHLRIDSPDSNEHRGWGGWGDSSPCYLQPQPQPPPRSTETDAQAAEPVGRGPYVSPARSPASAAVPSAAQEAPPVPAQTAPGMTADSMPQAVRAKSTAIRDQVCGLIGEGAGMSPSYLPLKDGDEANHESPRQSQDRWMLVAYARQLAMVRALEALRFREAQGQQGPHPSARAQGAPTRPQPVPPAVQIASEGASAAKTSIPSRLQSVRPAVRARNSPCPSQPVAVQPRPPTQLNATVAHAKTSGEGVKEEKATTRPHHPPSATATYLDHSSAPRVSTDTVIARALRAQYPSLDLTIVNQNNCQLLSYAAAGHATVERVADADADPAALSWRLYAPPAHRLDGGNGALAEQPVFAKYLYRWSGHEFTVYLFDGRDGTSFYPVIRNFYILSPKKELVDSLIMQAGKWTDDLHEEIFIFDQGIWSKSKELYASVREARWENVILDESMKKAVIEDHLSFFRSRDTYTGLKVPWKRGIIYYGPPGNGKTISIKATMNMLYRQTPEIPTLYVRTLASFMGPEYSIRMIFAYARRYAPCYLVFEDLDTIVSDNVRSYFLNEVDGLKNNDGIFMVGSTNHLDRLDPGISKRPSRFDRKYFFPDPNLEQRVAYCHFWQKKLGDSDDVEFPDKLCGPIAEATDKFSFAYMQEAFVAALLAIARKGSDDSSSLGSVCGLDEHHCAEEVEYDDWEGVDDECRDDDVDSLFDGSYSDIESHVGGYDDEGDDDDGDDDDEDLDKFVLWVELKRQIAILREGMEDNKA